MKNARVREKTTVRSARRSRRNKRFDHRTKIYILKLYTYLLDNGADIRKTLLVVHAWPAVAADDLVEFCVGTSLDLRMRRDECQ
jgi:hypothetical protein